MINQNCELLLAISILLLMRITKWGEYGILCSLFLGSKYETEKSVGAADIAQAQILPLQYAHQILQRLRRGDIVESTRGPKGGYRLTRTPDEINLRQILEASEGATFEVICESHPPYGEACGSEHTCALRGVWKELKTSIDSVLEGKTLAELLKTHQFFPGNMNLVSLSSHAPVEVAPVEVAPIEVEQG